MKNAAFEVGIPGTDAEATKGRAAIEAAIREEREACAKIADERANSEVLYAPECGGSHPFDAARRIYCKAVAVAIRARSTSAPAAPPAEGQ